MRSSRPDIERFWSKVLKGESCWEWSGPQFPNGYGRFNARGWDYSILAHRAVYQLSVGSIPDGMVIMHLCDNRLCVRPDHLRAGTQAENIRDMLSKGRGGRTGPKPRAQCGRGHGPDWYVHPRTARRVCRPCRNVRSREARKKRKESQ